MVPWIDPASGLVPFPDRTEAGELLAEELGAYRGKDAIVLALPRGGVPVGHVVARALGVPLDVIVVRKIGVPGQRELAAGAIASGGVEILNPQIARYTSRAALARVIREEREELARREHLYRGDRPSPRLEGRTVILVDDGLATGATMHAAARAVRNQGAAQIVIAVPVAPRDTLRQLQGVADEVVCLATPEPFYAIGLWYHDFGQVSDREVRDVLARSASERPPLEQEPDHALSGHHASSR